MTLFYPLLVHAWSGLVLAAAVALVGIVIVLLARVVRVRALRFVVRGVGYLVGFAALLMAVAAGLATTRITRAAGAVPPPGKLVDVGGYRLHILGEGDARGGPSLVWIPGGHAQGLAMYHLHKAMRGETRSILFDRQGMGWSDVGPLPASTHREAQALGALLRGAGEKGPFIVIGHSYGGLLAANFARRFPREIAAVVLLDPTPLDIFAYLPGGGGPNIPSRLVLGSEMAGIQKLFGLWKDPESQAAQRNDALGKLIRTIQGRLADVKPAMDSRSALPAGDWVAASCYREWFDSTLRAEAVVYDGELGDLPLFVVIPDDPLAKEVQPQLGLADRDVERAVRFLEQSRRRYLKASTRSEFIRVPAGSSHNFPYEVPEFVVETVRRVLAPAARQTHQIY